MNLDDTIFMLYRLCCIFCEFLMSSYWLSQFRCFMSGVEPWMLRFEGGVIESQTMEKSSLSGLFRFAALCFFLG